MPNVTIKHGVQAFLNDCFSAKDSPFTVLKILASATALASWDTQTRLALSVEVQPMPPQNCSPGRNMGPKWTSGPCGYINILLKDIHIRCNSHSSLLFWSSSGVNMYAMLTGTLPFTVEPFSLRALHQKMVDKEMNPLPPSLSTGKHKKCLRKQCMKDRRYRVSKTNRLCVFCYLL